MKVLKFGGTSVGSAQRIKDVANLITSRGKNIIVLSAMSGTTNTLVEISDYLYKKNTDGAKETINTLEAKYNKTINELYASDEYKEKAQKEVKACFNYMRSFTKDIFTMFEEKEILAQGELMSTAMMNLYLQENGLNSVVLPAPPDAMMGIESLSLSIASASQANPVLTPSWSMLVNNISPAPRSCAS